MCTANETRPKAPMYKRRNKAKARIRKAERRAAVAKA